MTKFIAIFLATVGFIGNSDAAPARRTRAQTADTGATPVATTSARSAISTRTTAQPAATSARSAVRTTSARAATAPQVGVVARAATTKQKVISTGTKVATAAKNVIVNEECRAKYNGCMDSFCMLDNATGGRCLCSNRIDELNTVLNEIEKLDQQTYQMATYGVERINMGDAADAAITAANDAAQKVLSGDAPSSNDTIDTASWFASPFGDDEEETATYTSAVEGKTGDTLHITASGLCAEQIPECAADIDMLQMLYAQQIKSDCAAYENTLKQQKNTSQQKLYTAEQALRTAALEQFKNSNKYDLGQCTLQFKKCMQTTADCGDDFSKCASMVAMDNTNSDVKSSKTAPVTTYTIQGAVAAIDISATTYDTLIAKKPLCEHITKSCTQVADNVWDAFLKEVAPQIKNAELIAEDNARQDCIGNISSCFQKACRENMDPNDPDGSYDLCLTQPETMLNLCKVPLNACGINATDAESASESPIWEYVVARLASMRVDSCTNAVKECLTAEDRCGKDYTKCIGMTTDGIMDMCPYEKLVGCQYKYADKNVSTNDKNAMDEEIFNLVQGIFMNIDNAMLAECQSALDESMLRVCGSLEDCNALTVDGYLGGRTLEYKLCAWDYDAKDAFDNEGGAISNDCRNDISQIQDYELGAITMSSPNTVKDKNGNPLDTDVGDFLEKLYAEQGGQSLKTFVGRINNIIPWESVSFIDADGTLKDTYTKIVDETFFEEEKASSTFDATKIKSELMTLQNNIASAIATIEADPTVQFCITGRRVQGMDKTDDNDNTTARYLGGTGDNFARFPQLTTQMRNVIATSALKAAKDNYNKKYDELQTKMAQDYVKLGERMAEIEKQNALEARRSSARDACAALAAGNALAAVPFKMKDKYKGTDVSKKDGLVGSSQKGDFNYKETVTTNFAWETAVCTKCVKTQNCETPKRKWCKQWGEAKETCTDIQF